ncbi:MAG: hypothetical protein A3A58_02625 [Candidatus Blackburnbacteria bacterium RIFCSPLOWO2_01_FULL_41_27]|uniref:Uncharacterized protein n=2 Tax=Candidatus Blackburniibacteriota TaxID=1817898 RepID=A0A1G1V6N3_9BACT|nr:MAG: hypothetical protein A3F61_02625 [Candidatus Blackburnbacteria bacterium RIFCSPHIGHO2_12_FULL_41_13b]OGY13089.1 MAG: hypothetical protein A3A58_02625 [Candidatus Blackburnbacteria bacterium RIFCSPLOWO2_01_FULL_41_27]
MSVESLTHSPVLDLREPGIIEALVVEGRTPIFVAHCVELPNNTLEKRVWVIVPQAPLGQDDLLGWSFGETYYISRQGSPTFESVDQYDVSTELADGFKGRVEHSTGVISPLE